MKQNKGGSSPKSVEFGAKQPVLRDMREVSSPSSRKRTLRVPDLLDEVDDERVVYPRGILGTIKESTFDSLKTERIELFARAKSEEGNKFGVLRQLFVAFSSEPKLLQLAATSSNVVEVHALKHEKDNKKEVMEDRLVLKAAEYKQKVDVLPIHLERAPDLFVSPHWLDLTSLGSGDRVIISNPREDYEVPPPNIKRK